VKILNAILAGVLMTATVTSALSPAAQAAAQAAPLIERAKLFGNPSRSGAQLSPDGKHLAWLAPRDGVMNIWVAPIDKLEAARPLTASKDRPIRVLFWAPDSSMVMYIQDKAGDENFLLYGIDVQSGAERTLTPFEKTRVQVVSVSPLVKDRILVGLNNRDPQWHDIHSLDLKTGKLTEIIRADGYAGFVADANHALRLALRPNAAGGMDYFTVSATPTGPKVVDKPVASTGLDDSLTTSPAGFTVDGKTLYWIDSRGRNTAALVAQDAATGATKVIGESPRADISNAMSNPRTGEIEAYAVTYLRDEWTAIDPKIGADLEWLRKELKGDINVTSRTLDDRLWTVAVDPVVAPSSVHLYDRQAKTLKQLYVSRPELVGAPLQPMYPLELKSRDGLTLPSYLTLPPGSDPDGDGRPTAPVPMVLLVHGGPWARDEFGYNAYHQWLANRGYAVVSPNFRGSTGFGKAFVNAGDGQWADAMHDDLVDTVESMRRDRGIDRARIGVMGGSYGGYMTNWAVAHDRGFRAAITDRCVSNLVSMAGNSDHPEVPGRYWKGAPFTDPRALWKSSPIAHFGRVRTPMLVIHSEGDLRCNVEQAEQVHTALCTLGVPTRFVRYPRETSHGMSRAGPPDVRIHRLLEITAWWAKWLASGK